MLWVCVGLSSEARFTSPSRNAYNASRNAFVIFVTNSGAMGFCFVDRDEPEEERSTPPATLKAAVVICFWKLRNWAR